MLSSICLAIPLFESLTLSWIGLLSVSLVFLDSRYLLDPCVDRPPCLSRFLPSIVLKALGDWIQFPGNVSLLGLPTIDGGRSSGPLTTKTALMLFGIPFCGDADPEAFVQRVLSRPAINGSTCFLSVLPRGSLLSDSSASMFLFQASWSVRFPKRSSERLSCFCPERSSERLLWVEAVFNVTPQRV